MPVNSVIADITDICLKIDTMAFAFYKGSAGKVRSPKLKKFLNEMADDEKSHVNFWKDLNLMARGGIVPQIFDDPAAVKKELHRIKREAARLCRTKKITRNKNLLLLTVYKLEYLLIYPDIERLFSIASYFDKGYNPQNDYHEHLEKLINFINSYKSIGEELKFLARVLTKLWKKNQELAMTSDVDILTGILNRRGFFNAFMPLYYLARRMQYSSGIIMLDLDDFKKYNDDYGHQTGDEILRRVAGLIKKTVRASDLVGRYGGEEFIIFLPSIEPDTAHKITEKIRGAIQKYTDKKMKVTASIGLVTGTFSSEIDRDLNLFIKCADSNMYMAKNKGKNRIVISSL